MQTSEVIARLKSTEPQLRALGVAGLYLFGSYARNEAGPDSDVDVFIDKVSDAAFGLDAFMGAYDVLRAALPVEVDYGTRAGLSELRRAVEHGLLIISEAAKTLPADLKSRAPEVAWRELEALGNFLRHEYRDVDPEVVWRITRENLPGLVEAAHKLLATLGEMATA